jgi:hypothetical protein
MGKHVKVDLGTIEQAQEHIRAMEVGRKLVEIADEIVRAVLANDDARAAELCFDYLAVRREHCA